LAGKDGLTTSEFGALPIMPIGRKILARIVADILVERRPDRQRAGVAEDQRVAVRVRLRHSARAHRAARRQGRIVDDDLLAEQFAHLFRHTAADDSGAAAREQRE
jgi:hypothetical protein